MLHLYNLEKVRIKGLKAYKDYCIESDLSTGDKTLSFLYPSKLAKDIKEECYIRNKNHEFVVKEITEQNDWKNIKATLNVEDLEGQPWEHFETIEKTIDECLTLAVAGTGWTVDVNGITKRRTIRKTNCSSWDIIQQVKKTYLVEIEFDTINKKVIVAEKIGSDKGTYFMDTINLRELAIQSNSYDFYTRIIAIGKDGIKATVENYQYSSKKKTLIWKDERYTDIKSLTEDATAKLNEISKPYRSYAADIIDLASINDKYSILSYKLGDTIYLISKDKGIKEKQRIIKTTEYPDEAYRNTCEIANSILSFADIQKEYQLTSDTVDNITSDDGTISEDAIKVAVEHLTVNKVDIGDFNAVSGRVGELEVSKLDVNTATIKFAEIDEAIIKKANITDLTAGNIKVDILEGGTAILQDILTNFISGENGQFIHLTGSNVVIDNAVIKDAMIDTISAGKISAGTMSTNKFTISSDSGNLVIADNTIQIRDGTRVRVQIGKDASNDYSLYVWDNTGKLMFDALGLKSDAIKDKIIRNDMVSDTANISGSKLDIDSVIVEVNTNGTETFKSSKVKMDSTGQTLDVAFTKVSQDAAGAVETANTAQTDVGIANGKIETLVKNTTIVKEDGTTVQLKDAYIFTEQTVEGMTTTVSNLETTVNGENGLMSKMQIVEQKITEESIVNTIKYSQTDGKDTFAQTSTVEQMVNQVKFEFNSVAITNLLVNSNFPNRLATGWSMQGVDYYTANPTAFTPYDGWVALQLTSDRGLFYQPIMAGDKLPKRNSKYTFSLSSKTEANIEIFRLYIDYKLGTNYVGNQLVDLKLGNNFDRYSVSFITKDVDYDQVLFYIEVKPKADTTGYRVFSIGLPCLSLGDSASYTSRQNEIMSGNTIIDANGVTVTNGALTVKNNAGNTVINGDSNGNLVLGGSSTSGSLLIKNSSGVVIGTLDKNGITLKDTGIKIINSSEGLVNGNYIGTKNVEFDASNIHFSGTVDVGQGGGSDSNAYIEFTPLDRSYLYGRLDYKANYNNFVGNLSVEGNTNVKELYADGWLRTTGNRGWYSQTYGGGIYMTDATWIRTYNGKNFYCDKILQGQTIDAVTLAKVNRIGGRGVNNFYLGSTGDIAGRIEANTSGVRVYTSWVGNADCGLNVANDGALAIKCSNTNRHVFAANGTKTGGTMEIEGTIYGMSPTDSPQTLIEYIEFNVIVDGETEVFLDDIYSKMISKFTAILSNSDIKIKGKRVNSIVLVGTGTTDIVFKGQRKEADQYFRIMNGFITQGYEKEGII